MTERAVAEENLKQFKNTPKGNLVNFILEKMKGPEFESDSMLLPSIWKDGARRCSFFAYHCFRLTQTSLKTFNFEDLFKQGSINDNLEANDNFSISIPSSDTIPIGFHFETNYTEQTLAMLEGFTVSNVTVKRHVDEEDELHGDVYEITFMIEDHSLSKKPDWRDKYTYARQYGIHVITIYFDGKKPAESRLKEVKAERQFYWETADGITKQWSEPEIVFDLFFEVYSTNSFENKKFFYNRIECAEEYYWVTPNTMDSYRNVPRLYSMSCHRTEQDRARDIQIVTKQPNKNLIELEPHATRNTFEPKVITFEEGQEEHIRSELIPKEIVEDEVWNGYLPTEQYEYKPKFRYIHRYDHTIRFTEEEANNIIEKTNKLYQKLNRDLLKIEDMHEWLIDRHGKYESQVHTFCIERLRKELPPKSDCITFEGASSYDRIQWQDYLKISLYQMNELFWFLSRFLKNDDGKDVMLKLDKITFNNPNLPQIINFQYEGIGITEEGRQKLVQLTLRDIESVEIAADMSERWMYMMYIEFKPESDWWDIMRKFSIRKFSNSNFTTKFSIVMTQQHTYICDYDLGAEYELYDFLKLDILRYFFIDFYTPQLLSKELEDVSSEIIECIKHKSIQFTGPLGKPEPIQKFSMDEIPEELRLAREDEKQFINYITNPKRWKHKDLSFKYLMDMKYDRFRDKGKEAWYESWIPEEFWEEYLQWRIQVQETEIKKIENRLNGLDIMMKSYWFWQIPPHLLRTWNKINHKRNEAIDELVLREEDLKQWQNSKIQKADA